LDFLLSKLQQQGTTSKLITVGSTAGLEAVRRGECDLAGIHLLDARTGEYNRPFLTDEMALLEGYGRCQGVVYRRGDSRFDGRTIDEIIITLTSDTNCMMINRNQGSGTRILIDRLLSGARPSGYAIQASNHNAVAAAVAQSRADWGLAIESVARSNDLGFLPYKDEQYDFIIPTTHKERPAVKAFVQLLAEQSTRQRLAQLGFSATASRRLDVSQEDLTTA
jgi:putative molybdopterin biosynthesis protein